MIKLPKSYEFHIESCLSYSNRLEICIHILARVMNGAVPGKRLEILQTPTLRETGVAWRLVDIHAAVEVSKHLGKLVALDPFLSDGVWVTQGRMRNGLRVALGMSKLQILMPHQHLAELEMTHSHNVDHKSSAGTLARSRSHMWIHQGRGLARLIVRSCVVCRIEKAENGTVTN